MATSEPVHVDPPIGIRTFLKALGPGLITGAADDDPSGIGTHNQIGAEFGYGPASAQPHLRGHR